MKLEHLTIRGFMTSFQGKTVTVDFNALPSGLIAIVGTNGAGKTTLLEAAPAGLYRQLMSREGDLKTYAQDRDSTIESWWRVSDQMYRSVLTVDGIRGTASAALQNADLAKPLNDGKVSTYDTAVADVFPPLHVFKASAFATQNKSGSFVKASKKERRDIFAAFLGVDRLIAMSETAKACAAAVDQVRVKVKAAIDVLERDTAAGVVEETRRQKAALEQLAGEAAADRTRLTEAIARAEQDLAQLSDQVAAHAAATDRVTVAGQALHERHTALDDQVAADTEAARKEAQDRTAIEEGYQAKSAALNTRVLAAAATEAAELKRLADGLRAKLADIDAKLAGNKQIQDMAADIRAAVAEIENLSSDRADLGVLVQGYVERDRELAQQLTEAERAISAFAKPEAELLRARGDAALVQRVPCGGRGEYAGCELLVNAKAAEGRIAELEATIATMVDVVATRDRLVAEKNTAVEGYLAAKAKDADLWKRLEQLQQTAKYADKLAASTARIEELHTQRADAEASTARFIAEARARHEAASQQRLEERAALDRDYADATARHQRRVDDRLELSRRKRALLQQQLDVAAAEYQTAKTELDALTNGHTRAAALQATLAALRTDRDTAVTVQATAEADAAAVTKRLAELETKAQQLQVLRGRLAKLDQELVDWQLLQKALDRDGLPNLEIDQAGPAISATANEILADCFGPRFSLELVTQVPRADGKGMKEEFTVLVTDNAHGGVQRDISDLSGGEEVIIDEALKNAIAITVNERSQTPMRTCFRDETTGALTKENTQRYVQMLRKVQAIGGFHQILFISHDPDAYALADAQIRVAGGAVTTVLPPYSEAA